MARRIVLVIAAAALLIGALPTLALAAPPEGYRVIDYRHADGGYATADGCIGIAAIVHRRQMRRIVPSGQRYRLGQCQRRDAGPAR